ncbi:hypothetical protein M885DRAFT_502168 [Pelagophyceae sp. CCMP2097]|nr:hypothetical protein M885DRAFT_502168 [Pelagophyceae sp. CCMP2097]
MPPAERPVLGPPPLPPPAGLGQARVAASADTDAAAQTPGGGGTTPPVAGGGMPPAERPVLGPPPPPPPAGLGQSLDENAAAAHAMHGLTTEQAHSLTQQWAAASRGSAGASSKKTYDGAFKFRWTAFAKMVHEDPSVLKSKLVGPGPAYKVNEGLIERFFYACWDDWKVCKHNVNHKSVFFLTAPTCDTLAKAVLYEVNLQLLEKMQPKLASIKGVRVIEMVLSDLRSSKAEQAVMEMQDIQASAHGQLMPADKIALVTKLLVTDLGDGMQCSLIVRFNMAYYFLHSLATASRSEDELGIVQTMEFIPAILEVGPDKAQGTLAHWQILNRGKTNQNGKHVYMAVLMHMNPLLCAPAIGGLLKLFRICCLNEPVQEFDALSDEDFVSPLYNTAVIRSDEEPSKHMPSRLALHDDALCRVLRATMSKIRLVAAKVEREAAAVLSHQVAPQQADDAYAQALRTVDALIPPSANKRSKKRNWEGLLKVIRAEEGLRKEALAAAAL